IVCRSSITNCKDDREPAGIFAGYAKIPWPAAAPFQVHARLPATGAARAPQPVNNSVAAGTLPVVFGRRFALSAQPHFLSLCSSKKEENGWGEEALVIPLSPTFCPLVPGGSCLGDQAWAAGIRRQFCALVPGGKMPPSTSGRDA
ncbi:MAG TPA: hypothetical protein VEL06_13250, partial [Haliangiales bacterium]|nr:hypothetical protein [Haliangiales bacterium]